MKKLKTKHYKYGELFAGPGGLALGAMLAQVGNDNQVYKIEHTWASDYDQDSCLTYADNIAENIPNSVICADVKLIDIKKDLSPIDIFAYGFPCNDFSIVGKQKGFNGRFGGLYTYGVKVLNEYKPIAFVAENVGGIFSANSGKVFKKILTDLSNAGNGYTITAHLYKAEEFGGLSRSQFIAAMRAEGVPCSTGYSELNKMPFIKNAFSSRFYQKFYSKEQLDYDKYIAENSCPNNQKLCNELAVWIPQNILLGSTTDMDKIATAFEKVKNNVDKIKQKA